MTSRFSDVPMGVPMPPICDANVMGISSFDGDVLERSATAVRIGIINTTCGVLFMNALTTAVTIEHHAHRQHRTDAARRG